MADQEHIPRTPEVGAEGPDANPGESSVDVELRFIRVIILKERFGGKLRRAPPTRDRRIGIGLNSTFRLILNELNKIGEGTWTIFQANYSSTPCWKVADLEARIPTTWQTIYVAHTRDTTRFVLALVRGSHSDYPLLIVEPREGRTRTVFETIVDADGDLESKVTSVTGFSSTNNVNAEIYDYGMLEQREIESFPTVFIITIGEPPRLLQLEVRTIPPFLQIQLVTCKELVRQAYKLNSFTFEMIHVSSAVLHAILSLSKVLDPDEHNPSAEDIIQVALALADGLQQCLDDLREVIREVNVDRPNEGEIRRLINKTYLKLCGEYPGAVSIRHSGGAFDRLRLFDQEVSRSPPQRTDPMRERTLHGMERLALDPSNAVSVVQGRAIAPLDPIHIAGEQTDTTVAVTTRLPAEKPGTTVVDVTHPVEELLPGMPRKTVSKVEQGLVAVPVDILDKPMDHQRRRVRDTTENIRARVPTAHRDRLEAMSPVGTGDLTPPPTVRRVMGWAVYTAHAVWQGVKVLVRATLARVLNGLRHRPEVRGPVRTGDHTPPRGPILMVHRVVDWARLRLDVISPVEMGDLI